MTKRLKRVTSGVVALLIVLTASTFTSAQPASAVHWTLGYGWGNTDVLCNGCAVSNSNSVGLWEQAVIVRFGGLQSNGDGIFDSGTSFATAIWQSQHPNLAVDGVVGSNTWNSAHFFHLGLMWDYGDWKMWGYTDTYSGRPPNDLTLPQWKPWSSWYTRSLNCSGASATSLVNKLVTSEVNDVNWIANCE